MTVSYETEVPHPPIPEGERFGSCHTFRIQPCLQPSRGMGSDVA